MKRITLLLLTALTISIGNAAENEMLKSGFFIGLSSNVPTKTHFAPVAFSPDESVTKVGAELAFGNIFKVAEFSDMAIGIKATWFDFKYSTYKSDYVGADDIPIVLGISLVRPGLNYSYALSDQIAVDAYIDAGYNTYYDVAYDAFNIGTTYEVGANFRYDVLCVGFSYEFGRIQDIDYIGDDLFADLTTYKVSTFNINLGVKF